MANVTAWEVVGVSRFTSKKNPEKVFYSVNCTRENDSLFAGITEVRRVVCAEGALDRGIDIGSHVSFFGASQGSDFVAFVRKDD